MPTPQELATDLTARTRAASVALRAPLDQEANFVVADRALNRLAAGLELANTMMQLEEDAGRTAVAQYRALTAAIDRASTVYFDGQEALTSSTVVRQGAPIKATPSFWTGRGPIVLGAVAVGLTAWLLLRKKTDVVPA